MQVEMMARREDWNDGISIFMRQRTVGGGFAAASPVIFVKHETNTRVEPVCQLDIQAGQQLMDELWKCGLRPTEGSGSAGSLAATERHLKDMQVITLGLLRKDKVQV